ncbi:MAG: sporulation protein YabP [Erysipelotrichia bacterium]|nr:sporulation protein YabP [Erysipelotrichia bacterium]NCC55841.1 sporulation protein YabP [Erysipelotrichia bacterium]
MAELNSIKFDANPYHNLILKDRKYLEISGIKQIDHFDEEEFLLESVQGWLEITGSELMLDKLDKERGEVMIKGNIETISYVSAKKTKESIIAKMFK